MRRERDDALRHRIKTTGPPRPVLVLFGRHEVPNLGEVDLYIGAEDARRNRPGRPERAGNHRLDTLLQLEVALHLGQALEGRGTVPEGRLRGVVQEARERVS